MNFRLFSMIIGAGAALLAQAGTAQEADNDGHHDMAAMMATSGTVAVTSASESIQAFKAADAKMHKAMMATAYTGDADVDFLRGMIPHHQGAVDMATIVLKYGTDAEIRMLAGDIIKAQEKEIRMMNDWLAKHGPAVIPDAKASDTRAEVITKPEVTASKPLLMTPGAVITLPDMVVKPSVSPTLVPATIPVVKKDIVTPVKAVVETMTVSATTTVAKAPVTDAVVKAVNVVSGTVVSGTLVTSTLPPVDVISATTAMRAEAITAITSALPDMPAPEDEILNAAPKMEFLDGPGLGTPAKN